MILSAAKELIKRYTWIGLVRTVTESRPVTASCYLLLAVLGSTALIHSQIICFSVVNRLNLHFALDVFVACY